MGGVPGRGGVCVVRGGYLVPGGCGPRGGVVRGGVPGPGGVPDPRRGVPGPGGGGVWSGTPPREQNDRQV